MENAITPTHAFDAAIALSPTGEDTYAGQTHPAYGNMVGPFGGTIGATLLNAILCHPERLGEPVSLTVHYAAPIADGGFVVHAKRMRTNRSTQHWLVELVQGDEVAAFATAVTAIRRDTWGATDVAFPQVPAAHSIERAQPIARAAWTACYDMRFIEGGPGAADGGDSASQSQLWIRDQPPRSLDYLSLAAICDAFFPRIFVRRPKWVPIGTVALTTYFHADRRARRGRRKPGAWRGARPAFRKGIFRPERGSLERCRHPVGHEPSGRLLQGVGWRVTRATLIFE